MNRSPGPIAITDPNAIRAFQMRAVISAIKLEMKGLRHSSGRSIRTSWAKKFGMAARSRPEQVIERLEQECEALGYGRRHEV